MAEKKPAPVNCPLVFVPALAPGMGLGHLKRALSLREAAGERGFLHVPGPVRPSLAPLLQAVPPDRILEDLTRLPAGACVVFDARAVERRLFRQVSGRAFTAALDEGGGVRPSCEFLIDTLPMIVRPEQPNARALPVTAAPAVTASPRVPAVEILVSFGGEDREDASSRLVEFLLSRNHFSASAISVVEGPLFQKHDWPAGVNVIRHCPGLDNIIAEYDLLFTHFGLGAYEALLRGVPVVLFNPTGYHRRLARADRLPEIGVRRPSGRSLERLLKAPTALAATVTRFREKNRDRRALVETVLALSPQGTPHCPVCGAPGGRALERFPVKTYFRCRSCKLIRLVYWGSRKTYAHDYFFNDYRNQYGKTYLEDFDHIRALGDTRMGIIEQLLPLKKAFAGDRRRLLDIGAAYGPFLAAARDRGCLPLGLEIAPEAAAYVSGVLGIPCLTGDFETEPIGVRLAEKSFDIISMWYVLEHFIPTGEMLGKANRLLAPGGILALGTPSAAGISYRKNRRRFLEQSPDDHFTVWSPATARAALRRFGFRVKKTVVTGHHPERFGALGEGRWRPLMLVLSRLWGLGDTFEVYAVKERECD
jgi:SAM-dependent methyltransferase